MSRELINRITLKKDGVYVSTHSSNDTSSYHSVKSNFLTECYKKDGKKGLDIGIIDRCLDNWELKGNHQSVIPYRLAIHKAFEYKKFIIIYYNCCELEEKVFDIANGFGEYKNYSTDERK